ncbi:metabotropic glutamate receptor 8-like [Haliotis cracherodii]|uniref:metabotropic glutamate receptor 8-like n=1 Tax=Haliotis cracherodii TaxID=6455 RepID=UPI0039ECDCA6
MKLLLLGPPWNSGFLSVFLICLTMFWPSHGTGVIIEEETRKIITEGDVIFGGLFPMHEKGQQGQSCGSLKKEKGIQRLEAMLYAIDRINNDDELLPGLDIGLHILDTCSFDTYALEQCMDFIKAQLSTIDQEDYKCADGRSPKIRPLHPVAGVIGAASSPVSIMVANILRLFKIPQISYASSSVDLSDKTRFEYFSRVVAPDTYQAQAMVDIAKAFGWNYVNTLADDGTYGEKGIGAFEDKAKKSGVCVSKSLRIPRSVNETTFRNIVEELFKDDNNARAVVMFVNEDNCRDILKALVKLNRTSHLNLLASDSWGAKIHPVFSQEVAAEGTVTILPKRQIIPEFDEYFLNLKPENNTRNLWFEDYWEEVFDCSLKPSALNRCDGTESLKDGRLVYIQEGLVQFVIDSVYALAHAVQDMLRSRCYHRNLKLCKHINKLAGQELLWFIRNVSFTGIGGSRVTFDSFGDGVGRYDIYQYQKMSNNDYDYVQIGEWDTSLKINKSALLWRFKSREIPVSICSEPCEQGEATKTSGPCCWVCIACNENEYLKDESTCESCPEGSRPNPNKTECARLPELHLDPASLWFILPVVFSCLGILCTFGVMIIFVIFNTTPIIMASGRELCYLLLLGIIMSYGTSLVMLAKPTLVLCALRRLGLGVSLSFIYAALVTKTNRIYRIFSTGIKAMVKRPSYTSPKSQILICICLVSVQVIGGLTWLGFEKPSVSKITYQKDFLILKCSASQIATIISLFYNIFLIVLCTVYAFKTRKIPQNFNEAKYIAFTMYSTCIVWLAFIPIYFGANHDFKIEVTSLCMGVSISATVALFCLFAPKVYVVLCQPHKNVRQATSTSIQSAANNKTNRAFYGGPTPVTASTAQNGSIHKDIQHVENNVFSDSLEETSSCDEGVAMQAPSSGAS